MANRPALGPENRLTRFIRSGKDVAETIGRVKPRVFMPPPGNKKLSVFHTERMNKLAIWELADNHLGDASIRFRADLSVGIVETLGLGVVLDNKPERHANIVDWPDGKDEQKLRAQELAAQAKLCSRQ